MDEKTAIQVFHGRHHAGSTPHGDGEQQDDEAEDGLFSAS